MYFEIVPIGVAAGVALSADVLANRLRAFVGRSQRPPQRAPLRGCRYREVPETAHLWSKIFQAKQKIHDAGTSEDEKSALRNEVALNTEEIRRYHNEHGW